MLFKYVNCILLLYYLIEDGLDELSKQEANEIIGLVLFISGFAILTVGIIALLCIRNKGHKHPSSPEESPGAQTIMSYVF